MQNEGSAAEGGPSIDCVAIDNRHGTLATDFGDREAEAGVITQTSTMSLLLRDTFYTKRKAPVDFNEADSGAAILCEGYVALLSLCFPSIASFVVVHNMS